MAISNKFDFKATLYFRIYDAPIYGGEGSVGYGSIAHDHVLYPENYDDELAESIRHSMALTCKVSDEKVEIISVEEYEEAVDEDEEWDG
mgnify:CR=1 FL=1